MKALKITLLLALFVTVLSSCTKQDLNEDDVLKAHETEEAAAYTGGGVNE